MRTFNQISLFRAYLRGVRQEGKTVGFVPTMGALHEGHLALMRRARQDCDLVVASIFVNPTQFGAGEDFESYPRDLDRDLRLAASEGVDALFAPESEEIYPAGFQTSVQVGALAETLEGAHRPGHFDGVATIVAKLLNIAQPDRAYFGQKDYQQFLIVERMAMDLNLPSRIVMHPTVREADGLAMSSRNAYLNEAERQAATILHRTLLLAEERVRAGETQTMLLQTEMENLIRSESLANLDYVALVQPDTLLPVETLAEPTLVALAVRIGRTRLIDNALIAPEGVVLPRGRGSRS